MTHLKTYSSLALVAALFASLAGACSTDDDDTNNNGGRAGANHGGVASGDGGTDGVDGSPDDAGAPGSGGMPSANAGAGPQGSSGGGGDAAGAGGGSALAALSDAQILLVLDTLNQGEVEEAYAALPRLTSVDVKAFAQQMVTDHSEARQSVSTAADALEEAPAPSETQAKLKGESEAHVALLRATSASNLDATYIELQVAAHAQALALLDDLGAAADAAQLTALIAALKAPVKEHYEKAQELQAEL